jgi:hypothetical protein
MAGVGLISGSRRVGTECNVPPKITISTPIHGAAFFGAVGCDRMKLTVAGCAQIVRRETVSHNQHTHDFSRAGSRQFPIGRELRSMDGNVVSMSFDPQSTVALAQQLSYAIKGGLGFLLHLS